MLRSACVWLLIAVISGTAGNYRAAAAFATALANEYERPGHYDKKPLDEAEARKWYAHAASQGNDGGEARMLLTTSA